MRLAQSIRARLLLAAGMVLLAFIAVGGLAIDRAHADSVRSAYHARLESTVYLLLAAAEVDERGRLVMPSAFTEPRLSLPGSGLYASVWNARATEAWHSVSAVGMNLPFARDQRPGEWNFGTVSVDRNTAYLSATYGVQWVAGRQEVPLVLSVLQDQAPLRRELATFSRTLWLWLGGAAIGLVAAQMLVLAWGLAPLRRVAHEIRRIEAGRQERVQGDYPTEISPLTRNLNQLIEQERVRQTRYKEALSFLAHSLKTPLAVLRNALARPEELASVVDEQVRRMDGIVQHQLGRAAAGGAARFVPPVPILPAAQRIVDALRKVHAARALEFTVECDAQLQWRIDEGDLFELLGNTLDNAAKWARSRVAFSAQAAGGLTIVVEDDGEGFPEGTDILQMHVRHDEKVPGHGVGLAIVKDVVESHHGEVRLLRSRWGGGRLEIVLPRG